MTSSEPRAVDRTVREPESSELILKVEGVSKKFSYSLKDVLRYGTRRLFREFLGLPSRTDRLERGEFWALDDVSFELRRGETLGIIGRNGAGKSTLLKVVNGIFLPDRGRVAVKGATAGLIEIGAGFQPNLTGRENVYIIASILGMTREQVDEVFDDVVAFADIGRFIDSPVQSYSSGMIVRLGFAIHVFQKPDVLLADEILAVGDFEFQQKCLQKITEIKREVGMILVSHSMPVITRFCDRALVLERGKVLFDGPPREAVRRMALGGPAESKATKTGPLTQTADGPSYVISASGARMAKSLFGPEYHDPARIRDVSCRWVSAGTGADGVLEAFSNACLEFSFCVESLESELIIGIPIYACDGRMITAFNSDAMGMRVPIGPGGRVSGTLVIPRLSLNPGEYVPCIAVHDGPGYVIRKVLDPVEVRQPSSTGKGPAVFFGVYAEECSWHFSEELGSAP